MKIGIVGGGTVGRATARSYLGFAEVRVHDTLPERRTHTRDEVYECDIVFICTPESQVEHAVRGVLPAERAAYFVIKSTVPVGTTRRLRRDYLPNLVHSPEFLTARCATQDACMPARNIIGGEGPCADKLAELYGKRFLGVPILRMSSCASELVKLLTNGFFAAKISYFNEAKRLVEYYDGDWDTVLAGILSDGRISHNHTMVPGPDGRRDYGGACLPKDVLQLCELMEAAQIPHEVVRAAYTHRRKS